MRKSRAEQDSGSPILFGAMVAELVGVPEGRWCGRGVVGVTIRLNALTASSAQRRDAPADRVGVALGRLQGKFLQMSLNVFLVGPTDQVVADHFVGA